MGYSNFDETDTDDEDANESICQDNGTLMENFGSNGDNLSVTNASNASDKGNQTEITKRKEDSSLKLFFILRIVNVTLCT